MAKYRNAVVAAAGLISANETSFPSTGAAVALNESALLPLRVQFQHHQHDQYDKASPHKRHTAVRDSDEALPITCFPPSYRSIIQQKKTAALPQSSLRTL